MSFFQTKETTFSNCIIGRIFELSYVRLVTDDVNEVTTIINAEHSKPIKTEEFYGIIPFKFLEFACKFCAIFSLDL